MLFYYFNNKLIFNAEDEYFIPVLDKVSMVGRAGGFKAVAISA